MTTQEIKGRLYDIERELRQAEEEMLKHGRGFKELAYGIDMNEGDFVILNIVTGMKKASLTIQRCLEMYETYMGLSAEKKALENQLKGRV